ncbi:MAG: hypothetical protein KAS96_04565 [Planctomycetes bacterium]|nr:hypothetical protein [Planctomycetota bacterium]
MWSLMFIGIANRPIFAVRWKKSIIAANGSRARGIRSHWSFAFGPKTDGMKSQGIAAANSETVGWYLSRLRQRGPKP